MGWSRARRDWRFRAAAPGDEEREPDEQEVEGCARRFATREMEDDRRRLESYAPQRRQNGELRFDACGRWQQNAEPAQDVEQRRSVKQPRRDLPGPRNHRRELRNGRGHLPDAGADEGQGQQALYDPEADPEAVASRSRALG